MEPRPSAAVRIRAEDHRRSGGGGMVHNQHRAIPGGRDGIAGTRSDQDRLADRRRFEGRHDAEIRLAAVTDVGAQGEGLVIAVGIDQAQHQGQPDARQAPRYVSDAPAIAAESRLRNHQRGLPRGNALDCFKHAAMARRPGEMVAPRPHRDIGDQVGTAGIQLREGGGAGGDHRIPWRGFFPRHRRIRAGFHRDQQIAAAARGHPRGGGGQRIRIVGTAVGGRRGVVLPRHLIPHETPAIA